MSIKSMFAVSPHVLVVMSMSLHLFGPGSFAGIIIVKKELVYHKNCSEGKYVCLSKAIWKIKKK